MTPISQDALCREGEARGRPRVRPGVWLKLSTGAERRATPSSRPRGRLTHFPPPLPKEDYSPSPFCCVGVHAWSVAESCPMTLCNLMGCSLPGSSVHGLSQARIAEWVVISCSRGSSQPRDRTCVFLHLLSWQVGFFPTSATWEAFSEWHPGDFGCQILIVDFCFVSQPSDVTDERVKRGREG